MRIRFRIGMTVSAAVVVLVAPARLHAQHTVSGTLSVAVFPSSGMNQTAVWLEDAEGRYAGTLFLTDFIGRRGGGNRTADPALDTGSGNRPDAFPVWAHRRNVVDSSYGVPNLYPPPERMPAYPPDIDAVSSATPAAGPLTVIRRIGGLPAGSLTVWAEVSRSFQPNEFHGYSFYRGQPSVLWKVSLLLSGKQDSAAVSDYSGYGSPDGSDGAIRPPDSTITTAADRLSVMEDGSRFRAVFIPDGSGSEIRTDEGTGPGTLTLQPNHPNPYNSCTSVSYTLPSAGPVLLSVHDALGKCVRILTDGRMAAGPHAAAWDGKNENGAETGSGVYVVRLRAGGCVLSRKTVRLR